MVLVTIVVLMTAMLVVAVAPALASAALTVKGEPMPTVVCDVVGDDSAIIGWRNGTCWVFHPVPVAAF